MNIKSIKLILIISIIFCSIHASEVRPQDGQDNVEENIIINSIEKSVLQSQFNEIIQPTYNFKDRKTILIYQDEGASNEGLEHIKHSLKKIFNELFEVKGVIAEDIRQGIDANSSALLIMPGGRATPYRQKLFEESQGIGNISIKKYIEEEGGCYLGLGAGAYYAGGQVMFNQGSINEDERIVVPKHKLLSFFPGRIIGPVFQPFVYASNRGAKAVKLIFEKNINIENASNNLNENHIYYNGGGFFDATNEFINTKVIARYAQTPEQYPAIVECFAGKGHVILSSVHPEYTLETFNKHTPTDPYIHQIKSLMSDEYSLHVFRFLLNRLIYKIK